MAVSAPNLRSYRAVIKKFKEADTTGANPHIIINSIDNKQLLDYSRDKKYGELTDYLASEINNLKRAGADFAIIAANTPHVIFDKLIPDVDLNLLSIVEETCKAVKAASRTTVGLLGTKYTMEGRFYQDEQRDME